MPANYTDFKMKKSPRNSALTKRDIKKVEKNVEGLDKKVGGLERKVKIIKVEVRKFSTKLDGVRNKIWLDMDSFKDEIKDEMALLRSDVAGMKDEMITEVKAFREEFVAHQGAHKRQKETLEEHEERISHLEQKPATP